MGQPRRFPGAAFEEAIGSGVTVIPLFAGFVLPPEFHAGAYPIEAALLEPRRGALLAVVVITLAVCQDRWPGSVSPCPRGSGESAAAWHSLA